MRRFASRRMLALAGLLSCLLGSPAGAIEVSKKVQVASSAENVWQQIGGFCAIARWHPIVEKCRQGSDGQGLRRILTLAGGQTVEELMLSRSSLTYTTQGDGGALPVANYRSTLRVDDVVGEQFTAEVTWSAVFDAKGASEEQATKVMQAIYMSGLIQIRRIVNRAN